MAVFLRHGSSRDGQMKGTKLHSKGDGEVFTTLIAARLDRLLWSRFHWLLVIGLGITWVLDGLEVTLVGAISAVLQRPEVLHFSAAEVGAISSAYLVGAVL